MRRGELVKLRWSEVDFGTGTIRILAGTSKSKRQRDVPMAPELRARLMALWVASARDLDAPVFANRDGRPWLWNPGKRFARCVEAALVGEARHDDSGWAIVYDDGEGERRERLNGVRGWRAAKAALWERRGKRAEGVSLHTLRHTFATDLLLNGVNPKVVSDLLGHSGIQVTLDVYGHVFPRNREEAISALSYGRGRAASDAEAWHTRGTSQNGQTQLTSTSRLRRAT